MEAWHFVGGTLRDGSPIPEDGEWLVHDGNVAMCSSGLHASVRAIDALLYAPGNTLCRVELRGKIIEGDDKVVASERKILWRIDAEDILFKASRKFALSVIHLWDAPEVVREFLETGDKSKQAAARDATRDAAWDAAGAAARAAARIATRDGARAAAEAAARAAALGASGAWAAAWDAAWYATRDAQEKYLIDLVTEAKNAQ